MAFWLYPNRQANHPHGNHDREHSGGRRSKFEDANLKSGPFAVEMDGGAAEMIISQMRSAIITRFLRLMREKTILG
jgi:hypothetical protein